MHACLSSAVSFSSIFSPSSLPLILVVVRQIFNQGKSAGPAGNQKVMTWVWLMTGYCRRRRRRCCYCSCSCARLLATDPDDGDADAGAGIEDLNPVIVF